MKKLSAIILLIILGVAVYANCVSNKFVWDDKMLVENNERIKSFDGISQAFKEDLFHMGSSPTGYYRPLQVVSYMFDHLLWGSEPFGYHISSILLQIANSILVLFLCLLIINSLWISFFIAAIFLVHPAFVPVVGYISGRADLLAMLFTLLSVYLTIKYISTGKSVLGLFGAILFYILAILSKEYYLISPAFILLYIFSFKDKTKLGPILKIQTAALTSTGILYLFLRATVLNFHQKMGVIAEQDFLSRLAVFPYIFARYIGTLIFPVGLGMEKKLVYSSFAEARFILSYIAPLVVAWVLYYLYKKGEKKKFFFLGWFVIGILPLTNLILPLKAFMADHWTYLASVGIFGFMALIVEDLCQKLGNKILSRTVKISIGIAVLIVLSALTIKENTYWRDEETFFSRTLESSPKSARVNYNMGKMWEDKGDINKAIEYYSVAIREAISPNAGYYDSRGMAYRKAGDIAKALEDCTIAVKTEPSNAMYHVNLGGIYGELDMIDKAIAEWREALKLDPNNELAKKNLEVVSAD